MRGVYYATIHISGLAALKTLMYITAPSTACVEVLSARITNGSNTTNQQLEAEFQRITSFNSDTSTAITPAKAEAGDQAAASTVKGNVTANEPTYTSNTQMGWKGFPSLGGYEFAPSPEERPIVPPSGSIGLRLTDTAPSAFDASVEICFREIG